MNLSKTDLPDDFQFSASALQDFVDCPRRFYLKYIKELRYAAPPSEPLRAFEQQAERGARFHRLAHQHQIGIPARALAATLHDDVIAAWWESYLAHPPADLPAKRLPEITLSAPLADRRLVARYDLLAVDADRAVIVDWKTAQRRPSRDWLARRLQTIVYPYVLARAGAHLNGGESFTPEAIRMIYWFAEFPQQPEIFDYSAEQFARDGDYLEALAADILRRGDDEFPLDKFPLTDDLDRCRFCEFRSLDGRGSTAGDLLATNQDAEDANSDDDLDRFGELDF